MKAITILISTILLFPLSVFATSQNNNELNQQILRLQQQTMELQKQLNQLQKQLVNKTQMQHHVTHHPKSSNKTKTKLNTKPKSKPKTRIHNRQSTKQSPQPAYHNSKVYVHTLNKHPESVEYNPEALIVEGHIATYIAGTPVVSAPYLGSRPSFDGSDYIVNIPSINRDVRLMQQRRKLYKEFQVMGYPSPNTPIITLSGKAEPAGSFNDSYNRDVSADWDLGSAELDAAAALNNIVEAYVSLAYDPSPGAFTNQRIANSSVGLGMGFINIGDLDKSPYYLTAGQIYVPFGRFSSTMISAPLTTILGRTKSRPFILGYQSQGETGPFAAVFAFKGDTTVDSGVGGANLGYTFNTGQFNGELGGSFISSINNSNGMQANGANPTFFGGFSSITNGNEAVKAVPAVDLHGILRFNRYNLTAEWVGTTHAFRTQDLSFNGHGAKPQALQLEAAATFMVLDKPSSLAVGYQWSKETLALRMPKNRLSGIFNISIWKDTVESIEYRHDIDYSSNQFANGAAPSGSFNTNLHGSGGSADTVLLQIGVYF